MGQYNVDYFGNPHGRAASLPTSANINAEEDVDLVVHVGDISYAQGYVADWDVFFHQLLPLTSRVPYMVPDTTMRSLINPLAYIDCSWKSRAGLSEQWRQI